MMIDKELNQQIKCMLGESVKKGPLFYFKNCNHVLHGLLLERRKVGIYPWVFIYPLFDVDRNYTLDYSFLMRDSIVLSDGKSHEQLNSEIAANLDSLSESLTQNFSLDRFCEEMVSSEVKFNLPKIKCSYGISQALLGNFDVATDILTTYLPNVRKEEMSGNFSLVLSRLLDKDFDAAVNAIDSFENTMISRLKLRIACR